MKDTRVETANEGMCIIMLSPHRTNEPTGCCTPGDSKKEASQ